VTLPASLAALEPRAVLGALRDGLDARPMDLPESGSRRILRGLAGLSLATAMLAPLVLTIGFLHEVAIDPPAGGLGQRVLCARGSILLGPAYFFYAPLEVACEEREGLEEVG